MPKFLVEIPDKFEVTDKDIRKILNSGISGAWHEPINVMAIDSEAVKTLYTIMYSRAKESIKGTG